MSEPHEHEQHDRQDHEDHEDDREHGDHQLISDRLPEGEWTVKTDGSAVNFSTRAMLGILPVSGVFESFSGAMQVDGEGVASGRLTIESGSLDTGIEERDEHLKSSEFLHAIEHPHMVFSVDSISPTGEEHLNLSGELRIREQRIPMAFPVYAVTHGDHLHIEGRAVIDHKRAGLGWAKAGRIGSRVKVQISLTLNRAR